MLIIVGFLVVIISVLGGYLGAHGRLGALWQPYELVIIGGAALGAFLVGTPAKTVKQTLQAMVGVFKGPRYKQQDYIDVLSLLYELLNKARREGFMALEDHVERPAEIRLRYLDHENEFREIDAKGLLATCIQHEIDHLDGVLFVDHISALKRNMILRKLAKAKRSREPAAAQ